MASGVVINNNDIIRVITANGAGYGDPKLRSREAIANDIKNGYVTAEYASKVYNYKGGEANG